MFLENRSILFFSAQAFGYQNEIRAEMERMGARMDYFDERPANSFAVKAAIRINRNLLARYIDRYHARIIERTKNRKYDYVFFIKGESVSVENLNKIKELHPEAKLIIYHWDSIANNRNALRILPVFDRAFSFDKPDCEKLGIRFLPLFYLRDYEKIGRQEPDYRYDLLFVGTVHSDRYGLLRRVSGQIERAGGRCFAYMFFQSRVLYWKMKLRTRVCAARRSGISASPRCRKPACSTSTANRGQSSTFSIPGKRASRCGASKRWAPKENS